MYPKDNRLGTENANSKMDLENKPGNEPGEEMYEIEMSLEELAGYLFNDLELPELEKKNFKFTTQEKMKRKGKRPYGIRPRLSKKETIKQKIRRKKAAIKAGSYDPEVGERFTFHESDLRYKHIAPVKKENTAAVVFFVMDVSGSMTTIKKVLARSFFFLLYQFLNHKYSSIDVVFVSHTTEANEVNEEQFLLKFLTAWTMALRDYKKLKKLLIKDITQQLEHYTLSIVVMGRTGLSIIKTLICFPAKRNKSMMCYTEIGEHLANTVSLFSNSVAKRNLGLD